MPATAPGMCVLYAEQFEILFPIRTFLSERRIAKARLNPGGDTLIVYPSLLHVIHVFVACNGTFPKRAIVDCANQITFPARFHAGCHEIAHAEKVALTTDGHGWHGFCCRDGCLSRKGSLDLRVRTRASTPAFPDWGAHPPRVSTSSDGLVPWRAGDRALAVTNFFGETGLGKTVAARVPKPSRRGDCCPAQYALRPLRRDAIGQRVGMKIGMITQTSPRTVLLGRLRDAVLFARRKVVPGIVPGDG